MLYINDKDIGNLDITYTEVSSWVKEAFLNKESSDLPHKISQTFNDGDNFINTMPAIIPAIDSAGVKVVSRYPNRKPSIKGEILLYSYSTGELKAILDATRITTLRTGAVASLAVETFAKENFESIAVIGLGQTGKMFLDIFSSNKKNLNKIYKLRKHNNAELEAKEILLKNGVDNNNIVYCDTDKELISNSDVIISAITVANNLLGKDSWYKKGVTVIPIHTRGFQNCDLFFDKVFADDKEHVSDFINFDKFKSFDEIENVLKGKVLGRESDEERILSYNIGIAIHDIYLGKMIFDKYAKK